MCDRPNTWNNWHCAKCHPCGEELDKIFKKLKKNE
jgi:hypothetical protein